MKKMMKNAAIFTLLVVYNLVVFSPAALAYIDPSTTTFLIQAGIGVAVTVGSFAVFLWRKAKKRINEKIGIDLDKNKETEEEFQIKEE